MNRALGMTAGRLSVLAPDLVTANRAMTRLAAQTSASGWPADVRFAAPPRPVIGAPVALFAIVRKAIPDATLVVAPDDGAPVPDGLDAIVTTTQHPGDPGEAGVHTAEFSVLARPHDDAVALMSAAALGRFLAALPPPMQLGKVEFADGAWRTAFGCDAAAAGGKDISTFGGWPAVIAAGAVPASG